MKKFIFICFVLFSCQQPKKHSFYLLKKRFERIKGDRVFGDNRDTFEVVSEIDTIKKDSDTAAVKKALSNISKLKFGEDFTHGIRNISYEIIDNEGKNLRDRMSASFIDSIAQDYQNKNNYVIKGLREIEGIKNQ